MASVLKGLRLRFTRDLTILLALAVVYVAAGWLGLQLAFDHPATSLVWPSSGIAVGAFLVLGYRVWPAILIAAVALFGAVLGAQPLVLVLAAGETASGLVAAYLVNRFAGGRHAFQNPQNVFRFTGLTLLTSATVSATIGTLSVVFLGGVSMADADVIWVNWSLGTLGGCLLVAPAVVLFTQGSNGRWKTHQIVEAVALFLAILILGAVVFFGVPREARGYPFELLCAPVLLWAAFRFGRRTANLAVLLLTVVAVVGTLESAGPFVRSSPTASLTMVMLFMGLMAVMSLSAAALSAEYAVAEAQLLELVVTDPLTGLPNYRRLVEVLAAEIARANRTDKPFAVVFFDMDGLKRINDELGHLIGSRAVCRFAQTLAGCCRGTDTAARYGGDEFVAVLPDTDEEGANMVVTRIVDRLAEDHDKPELSVSAGVAVYPRDGSTPTTLLSAADRALYAVKAEKANARRRGVVPIREWTSVAR